VPAIIVTFARRDDALAYASALQVRLDVRAAVAAAGAWGEVWDGCQLVVAWVTPEQVASAHHMAREAGGTVHHPAPEG
jgi:hypothetical protein